MSADAVRALLMHIGTRRKSIQPQVLGDYPQLLALPCVTAKAGAAATDSDRARAARELLEIAISTAGDDVDCEIAAAILAARPEFEGQLIEDRKKILDERGISVHMYKRRHRHVLDRLAAFMVLQPPREAEEEPERPGQHPRLTEPIRASCLAIGAAAVGLHYAALASLYVTDFQNPAKSADFPDVQFPGECEYALFDTFTAFLHAAEAALSQLTGPGPELNPEECRLVLATVGHPIRWTLECGPFSKDEEFEVLRRYHPYHTPLSPYHDPAVIDLFMLTWRPWHTPARRPHEPAKRVEDIEALAAYSGALALVISEMYEYNRATELRTAEAHTFRTLCRYYGYSYTNDGDLSSNDVRAYCHTTSDALTKRGVEWLNYSMGISMALPEEVI